jgi:hyperosmotically inducible periplasmic protein
MKRIVSVLFVLAAFGCDRDRTAPDKAPEPAKATEADNTEKNTRDRGNDTLLPTDQMENETDRTITQNIRKGVMDEDDLSVTAKNVKIITRDGVVTLRGPVKSDTEKTEIGALAMRTDGVKRVDNQLEIATD